MGISHLLLYPTCRSTTGCIAMEETFCTVFCHAMVTHQQPVCWSGSFEMVLCTATWLLDCRFAPDSIRWTVNSAVQWSQGQFKNKKKRKSSRPDRRELHLKSWTCITPQAVSEHELRVVPQSEGRIQGK